MSSSAGAYVDGSWQAGAGAPLTVHRPFDGSELAHLSQASDRQVHDALVAAGTAQREWARVPAVERGSLLRRLADLIAEHRTMLAGLITDEVGKRRSEAADELAFAEAFIR